MTHKRNKRKNSSKLQIGNADKGQKLDYRDGETKTKHDHNGRNGHITVRVLI
jgi:hypothetical protein